MFVPLSYLRRLSLPFLFSALSLGVSYLNPRFCFEISATAPLRRDAHAVMAAKYSNRTRVRYISREIIQNKSGNTRSNYFAAVFPISR